MADPPPILDDVADRQALGAFRVNNWHDHLQWWRDTRPAFKGDADVIGDGPVFYIKGGENAVLLESGVPVEVGISTRPGEFSTTPATNVGSWTVSSSPTGDGQFYGLVIPTDGILAGTWKVSFKSDADGPWVFRPQLNSANISGAALSIDPLTGGSVSTGAAVPFLTAASKNDVLTISVQQSTGQGDGLLLARLWVRWLQSND